LSTAATARTSSSEVRSDIRAWSCVSVTGLPWVTVLELWIQGGKGSPMQPFHTVISLVGEWVNRPLMFLPIYLPHR
jgi:hypothetical protein